MDAFSWQAASFFVACLVGFGGIVKWVLSAFATRDERMSTMHAASQIAVDRVKQDLNDFKVVVAQTYASNKAVEAAEANMTQAVTGVYERLDTMNSRLDEMLLAFASGRKAPAR